MRNLVSFLTLSVMTTMAFRFYPPQRSPYVYPSSPYNYYQHRGSTQRHPLTSYTVAKPRPILAKVDLVEGSDSGVSGTLYLKQNGPRSPVFISGHIGGLTEGPHGFHVHMNGALTNECKDAGGHFNPFMKTHGDPSSRNRHVGDLGNIMTFSSRLPTEVLIMDKLITLEADKENSILGRAIVVHAGPDDLGRGGDDESLKTGNAGGRVACGIITEILPGIPY